MQGLLVLNKPGGMTSRGAVDVVQRLVRPAKAGHAGTLDPLATGVLVVCVGGATRLIEYVQRMPKRYRGTFLLGRRSETEDVEGDVVELANPPVPTRDEIVAALPRFTGQLEQRPPAFSALKVAGKRAYDLARKGHEVELKPRPITVYRLELVRYEYPELTLDIECSGGTYVRSLGRDLAESLGTAAVMSALTRNAIGGLTLEQAISPDTLTRDNLVQHLRPPLEAVSCLPRVQLDDGQIARIRNGMPIEPSRDLIESAEYAGVNQHGKLVAILGKRSGGLLGPTCNLPD